MIMKWNEKKIVAHWKVIFLEVFDFSFYFQGLFKGSKSFRSSCYAVFSDCREYYLSLSLTKLSIYGGNSFQIMFSTKCLGSMEQYLVYANSIQVGNALVFGDKRSRNCSQVFRGLRKQKTSNPFWPICNSFMNSQSIYIVSIQQLVLHL